MTKKLLGGIIGGFVIVFSFQNCQKSPHADEISSSPSVHAAHAKVDLKDEKLNQIDFIVQENEIVTRAGNSYELVVNKTLQINLATGVFQVVSDLGGAPTEYCLTENLKNELVSILKSSQICKAPAVPAGQVCAQAIKPAYAQLLTDVDQFDLGAATDSCGTNSQDLCETQATMLKAYIANLKNQYKTLSCQ